MTERKATMIVIDEGVAPPKRKSRAKPKAKPLGPLLSTIRRHLLGDVSHAAMMLANLGGSSRRSVYVNQMTPAYDGEGSPRIPG